MSFLSHLPVEALSCIVAHLEARHVCDLWDCGDRVLNWKLSRGGVVKSLRFHENSSPLLLWPSHIALFEWLDALSLFKSGFRGNYPAFRPDYEKIPENVKSLSLFLPFSVYYLKQAIEVHPGLLPNLTSLKIQSTPSDAGDAWDVVHNWPNLQSLIISDFSRSNFPLKTGLLPLSLTNLECLVGSIDLQKEKLPDTLLSLILTLKVSKIDFSLLPRQLTSLSLTFPWRSRCTMLAVDWEALPRGLTKLELDGIESFDVSHARQLPHGLLELQVAPDKNCTQVLEITQALPRSLTSIGSFILKIDASIARALPRGFVGGRWERVEAEAVPALPPSMTRMHLWSGLVAGKPFAGCLPPHLSELHITDLQETSALELPTSLTTLIEHGCLSLAIAQILQNRLFRLQSLSMKNCVPAFATPLCYQYLPSHLTRLDTAYAIGDVINTKSPSAAIQFPSHLSAWLPRTLTYLALGPFTITSTETEDFMAQAPTCAFMAQLPPSLIHLHLYTCTPLPYGAFEALSCRRSIRNIEIRTHGKPSCGLHHFLATLPPHLEQFSWNDFDPGVDWADSDLTSESIRVLPRSLLRITLPAAHLLTEDCGQHIPPYMVSFSSEVGELGWFTRLTAARRKKWDEKACFPSTVNANPLVLR